MDKFESMAMLCAIAGKIYGETKKIARQEKEKKKKSEFDFNSV